MRRRVALGASRESPSATTRMAVRRSSGVVSLGRNPLAPARIAPNTYSSRSNVVRMITRVAVVSGSAMSARVAASPSVPGMRMSMSTTSGCSRRTSSIAPAPSSASPTTSRPGSRRSRTVRPRRTRASSSTTATRIMVSPGARRAGWRSPGSHLRLAVRPAACHPTRRPARACRADRARSGGWCGRGCRVTVVVHLDGDLPVVVAHADIGPGRGPACLRTLVSASWTTRYAVSPSAGGTSWGFRGPER